MEKKLYLVEVMSTFRMRYVVEAKCDEHARDEVTMLEGKDQFNEFSQQHIGTQIFSSRKISKEKYLKLFDEDNSYLSSWPEEKKFGFINKINYIEDKNEKNSSDW